MDGAPVVKGLQPIRSPTDELTALRPAKKKGSAYRLIQLSLRLVAGEAAAKPTRACGVGIDAKYVQDSYCR
jgi:hypothetical protein